MAEMTTAEMLAEIRAVREEIDKLEISDAKRKIGNAIAFVAGLLFATAFWLTFLS